MTANGHFGFAKLDFLQAGRATNQSDSFVSGKFTRRGEFTNFDGPVTHIKLKSNTGTNFKTGVIRTIGSLAA